MKRIRLYWGRPIVRGKAEFISAIKDLSNSEGCTIQALDADMVASERHAYFAAEKAEKAFHDGRNVAKDLGMEILRYASGERQIGKALWMGVSDETVRVAIITVSSKEKGPNLEGLIEEDAIGPRPRMDLIREAFKISEEEISAVGEAKIPDLVLERVALVEAYR
ncbi:MAG: hypothetical protein JW986_07080 [Methanotrichaceae archaeon]|nr:hypothetical protein [Methanotrichaceae archaeon]